MADFVPGEQLMTVLPGLYCWAKFGWNLGCYACHILSQLRNIHDVPQGHDRKVWRNAQNRKYIMYCNATRGGLTGTADNTHKNMVNFSWVILELSEQTDRQTDILITILCTRKADQNGDRLLETSGHVCLVWIRWTTGYCRIITRRLTINRNQAFMNNCCSTAFFKQNRVLHDIHVLKFPCSDKSTCNDVTMTS